MTPEKPTDVILHYTDGTLHPIDITYVGTDSAGMHRWVNTEPLTDIPAHGVSVGMLPARTTVEICRAGVGSLN